MVFDYPYCNLNGSSQYYENDNSIVTAKYIPAKIDCDKGNPFIEALPLPRTDEEINIDYEFSLSTYKYSDVKNMSTLEKMLNVSALRTVRFNLPFHKNLEYEMYNALLTSYRARKLTVSHNNVISYISQNEKKQNSAILTGNSAASTNAGFSLIGYSGCGKSSAVEILVSHYPQVIIHDMDDYGSFLQITYLVVNCTPNSNFSALYEGIGEAIDKALGNLEPVYALEINKCRGLGMKAEKVKSLVEKFGIGIIIFDEIQLIDFEHTKENSFESLMVLANRTKVAIAVVGTEDAKDKMFSELRTSRRLGTMISGNNYCLNKNFFDYLAKQLFRYQWFDEPIAYTDELSNTLYHLTKGIIDQLICLYTATQIEYLRTSKRPTVNSEYFTKIAKKYFAGIQEVLANLENTENVKRLNEIRLSGNNKLNELIDDEKQKAEAEKLINNASTIMNNNLILSNVISMIKSIYDYSDVDIQKTYKSLSVSGKLEGLSEKEIAQLIIKKISSKTDTGKKNKNPNVVIADYQTFLDI